MHYFSFFFLSKSQNLTFYMQIIFALCVFFLVIVVVVICCCFFYITFCWVLNSCYKFMILFGAAAFIGWERDRCVATFSHADKMKYYMLSAFSLPNKQMFEFIMTVGRTCGWMVTCMRIRVLMVRAISKRLYATWAQIQNRMA